MSSSNGVDLGSLAAMIRDVLEGQQAFRREVTQRLDEHSRILAEHSRILAEHGLILAEHSRLLFEHSRELRELRHDMTTLRQTVVTYHSSVIGHGLLLTELESRVLRIEQRLDSSAH